MNNIINTLKNSLPKYALTLPSTEKTITFRPFTVKEEKSLILGKETGSYTDFLLTISNIIDNCFGESKINSKKLPIFDIEYMFLKLRAKSVSELINVSFICPITQERVKADVNIDEIKIKKQKVNNKIKITDEIIVNMRYPTLEFLIENTFKTNQDKIDLFEMVIGSIESIETPTELVTYQSFNKEFLLNFIDSLTKQQYELILDFFVKSPKIEHEVKYKTEDGTERTIIFRGIRDFFQ